MVSKRRKIDRMLSGRGGYLEYICGHILCHSLLSASPAQKTGFSYTGAAVTVWIANSHKPYGVAGKKTSHFFTWTNITIAKHKHINIYVFSLGKNIVFNLMLKNYWLPDEQITR